MNWTRYDRLDKFGKIGWRIGAIRRDKKLTDIEVAEKLQMDIKTYRKVERNTRTYFLTLGQVYNLIEILNCNLEEFISL